MTRITSVHDLVFLSQIRQAFYHLRERSENIRLNIKHCTSALMKRPIEGICGKGYGDTNRNANFAQYLLWDLACFLQGLVKRATILA